jgi:hypothetical protein
MRPFIVKQLDYDLTPVAGLSLVGHHLDRLVPVFKQIDVALPVLTGGVANLLISRPSHCTGRCGLVGAS